jgi:hypothetical protein
MVLELLKGSTAITTSNIKKEMKTRIMVTMLVVSVLVSAINIQLCKAGETIYIKADGIILITIPGDVDDDRRVDSEDLAIVLLAYGKRFGKPGYVPSADINNDGRINGKNLATVSKNYGKANP